MAEHVIITEGSGINVIPIDAFIKKIATNDANVTLEPNTFYELGSPSLQTLTLPLTDKDGDIIGISGIGGGGFKIIQTIASHQILFGNNETTLGTFGTLESTQINSVLYLRRLLATGLYLASTPQGEFLLDVALTPILVNAINDTSKVSDLVLTSTGNNVDIDGVSPNIDLNVGKVLTGLKSLVVNNSAPAIHGDNVTNFGNLSGKTNQGAGCSNFGAESGENNQGAEAGAFGFQAGKNNQGVGALAGGHAAGRDGQGDYSLALAYKAAENGCADYSINLGANCSGTAVNGRLAFGPHMENITALGAVTASQQGYANIEWKGTHYRIPLFDGAATENVTTDSTTDTFTNKTFDANATGNSLSNVDVADLANGTPGNLLTYGASNAPAVVATGTSGQTLTSNGPGTAPTFQDSASAGIDSGFVQMVMNGSSGRSFSFLSSWIELAPTSAAYFSDTSANFTNTTNGRLQYTGAATREFKFIAHFNVASSDDFRIGIGINGSVSNNSKNYGDSGHTVFMQFTRHLDTNDEVTLECFKDSSGSRTVKAMSLSIVSID